MAETLIPPRRDDLVAGKDGVATQRYIKYMEAIARVANSDIPADLETQILTAVGGVVEPAVNRLSARLSNVNDQLQSLEMSVGSFAPGINRLTGGITELKERIDALEMMLAAQLVHTNQLREALLASDEIINDLINKVGMLHGS